MCMYMDSLSVARLHSNIYKCSTKSEYFASLLDKKVYITQKNLEDAKGSPQRFHHPANTPVMLFTFCEGD